MNSLRPLKTKPGLSPQLSQRIVRAVFKQQKKKWRGDVNVVFVSNKTLRTLSKTFLRKDHFTDVIAFPAALSTGPDQNENFGDVFVSVEQARINATRFGDTWQRELIRLVVHGTLHLLGHDDHQPAARKKMWTAQETLVAKLSQPGR
jgi:probable rRNA maturation factor